MNWFQKLFCPSAEQYTKELETLKTTNSDLNVKIDDLKAQIIAKQNELTNVMNQDSEKQAELEAQIFELKQQINKFEKLDSLKETAELINSNHAKVTVTYSGRTFPNSSKAMEIPLQLFITAQDPVMKSHIEANKLFVTDPSACNETIYKIYQYTRNNPNNPYRYKSDQIVVGFPEFWMFPFELRYAHQGDCDDWGNELASYLLIAGVPRFRVRCVAGTVRGYNKEGHLTVYVLGDDLKTWYHLNSTTPPYQVTQKKLEEFPTTKDQTDLIGIGSTWFSYNDEYAWSDFEGTKTDASNLKKAKIVIKNIKIR
jgi:predicted transglutaminase-like cysteine proteinase